jgi:hypothetical protein
MDNDWFAFLAQQPGIDEVNLLSIKKQGLIFKEYLQVNALFLPYFLSSFQTRPVSLISIIISR